MVKFILIALFVPYFFSSDDLADQQDLESAALEQDILKAMVGVVDLVGFYYILNQKKWVTMTGEPHLKVLAVSLGWAAADLLSGNLLKILINN